MARLDLLTTEREHTLTSVNCQNEKLLTNTSKQLVTRVKLTTSTLYSYCAINSTLIKHTSATIYSR